MRIFLTGFMGVGKTTVGGLLAARLRHPFFDLDRMVEQAAKASVAEIFARGSESEFRLLEADALRNTDWPVDCVVATGGGCLVREENLSVAQDLGVVVWIDQPFDTIAQRVGEPAEGERPLFSDLERARGLYQSRRRAYEKADLHLVVRAEESPSEVAFRIADRLRDIACAT